MNNQRGWLAEFLVARAVNSPAALRIEWDGVDVIGRDGTRIEVKATGRWQAWAQVRPTPVRWSLSNARLTEIWDEATGSYVPVEPWERLDAWVFALHDCETPADYDPLDLEQWRFHAIPHRTIVKLNQGSAGQSTITRLGYPAVAYDDLAAAVNHAAAVNTTIEPGSVP